MKTTNLVWFSLLLSFSVFAQPDSEIILKKDITYKIAFQPELKGEFSGKTIQKGDVKITFPSFPDYATIISLGMDSLTFEKTKDDKWTALAKLPLGMEVEIKGLSEAKLSVKQLQDALKKFQNNDGEGPHLKSEKKSTK